MKTAVYFKHFLSAFAALVLLCVASSCKDQNFDWENAHAVSSYEKFSDVFIKEFGKPAEGHQWGFDAVELATAGPMTRGTYKWEEVNKPTIGIYGSPDEITLKEHQEVYAWFSNHRVVWTHNPSYWIDGQDSRETIDGYARVISTDYERAGYGSLINTTVNAGELMSNYDFNNGNGVLGDYHIGTDLKFTAGWVQTVAENPTVESIYSSFPDGKIIYKNTKNELYKYDGNYIQADEEGKAVDGGSTITDPSELYFYKVVSSTVLYKDQNNIIYKEGTGTYKPKQNTYPYADRDDRPNAQRSDLLFVQTALDKAGHMDYVCYWDSEFEGFYDRYGQPNHLKDWNNHDAAYGWGRQPSTDPTGKYSQYYKTASSGQIGTLITNSDVNNWTFKSSEDGGNNLHDKFFMVYLKGDDYEGWYIGFDFEASNPSPQINQSLYADGICNDWIIKVSAASNKQYQNFRIMCEDLGGEFGISTTDIDYNDIVLDVNYEEEGGLSVWKQKITLTLKAAGGTLPLLVTYNDNGTEYTLFETHEILQNNLIWDQQYKKDYIDYSIMYNTNADNGTSDNRTRVYTLYYGQDPDSGDGALGRKKINSLFNVRNIKFKVYRHGVDDYTANPPSGEPIPSEWITLENIDGEPPLMICVPQSVKWLLERHKIDLGYPDFRKWVGSPSYEFWSSGTTVSSHLYN